MAKSPPPRKRFHQPEQRPAQPRLWGKGEVLIDRMSQEGRGIASRDGKVVFVSGALPGEQVRVQCTAVKRDYDEAAMLGLAAGTDASVERVAPPCPVYLDCGGCTLQHWSPAAQQQHKQANLLLMLQAITPALVLDPPITSRPKGFRHRLRVVVTRSVDKGFLLGLRQRRSHDVVNVPRCLVANTAVNSLLQALPALLSATPELQGLREIEIDADSNNQLGLCFYFAANPGEKTVSELRNAVLGGSVIALRVRLSTAKLNTLKKSRSDALYDEPGEDNTENWQELYTEGALCLRLEVPAGAADTGPDELLLTYLPGDFTQTHWEVNAALVARAIDWLQPASDERALDLFSGIGNFSLPLARRARSVDALEGNGSMSLRLGSNAERNGITNISAKTSNLMAGEVVLPRADIAVVDPPRAGAKVVCEALARSKVQRLVYVSCHPATLLRDARILQAAGFNLTRAAAVDMFPHTGHSEAIVLFQRKPKRR